MKIAQFPILRHPCAVLLIVQLLGIVVYPFLSDQPVGRALFSTFALLVLVLAAFAVRLTPALTWVSVVLGLPVVVLTIWEAITPGHETVVLWSSVFHAAFYFYTAYALLRYMFDDHVVTTDEIYATGATFTVAAWGFAYLYLVIDLVWPNSFSVVGRPEEARAWFEMLYLSITTMTGTGLSDIVPIEPHARSAVLLQQIAGMLYLALVVARMIGIVVAKAATRDERRRQQK